MSSNKETTTSSTEGATLAQQEGSSFSVEAQTQTTGLGMYGTDANTDIGKEQHEAMKANTSEGSISNRDRSEQQRQTATASEQGLETNLGQPMHKKQG